MKNTLQLKSSNKSNKALVLKPKSKPKPRAYCYTPSALEKQSSGEIRVWFNESVDQK